VMYIVVLLCFNNLINHFHALVFSVFCLLANQSCCGAVN
jgi:hypothetical protein